MSLEHPERILDTFGSFAEQRRDLGRVRSRTMNVQYLKPASQVIYHVDHIVQLGDQKINVFAVDWRYER